MKHVRVSEVGLRLVGALFVTLMMAALMERGEGVVFKGQKKQKANEPDKKTVKMGRQALVEGDPGKALRIFESYIRADSSYATTEVLWLAGRALKALNRNE